MKRWIKTLIFAIAGTLFLPGIFACNADTVWYTNSIFSCFLLAINIYLINHILPDFEKTTRRNQVYAVLFAFALSVALFFGAKLETDTYIEFLNAQLWISIIGLTIYLSPFIHIAWERMPQIINCLVHKTSDIKDGNTGSWNNKMKKLWYSILDTPVKTWITIFLLWLPTFLALFPGAFVYDAQDEYVQVATRQFTTHHPLFHVLMLGVPIRAAEHFGLHANAGIAVYTILQMAVMAAVFTELLHLLRKWHVRCLYRSIVLLIVGIFPVFPMYAVCSAKDTLFTGMLLIVLMLLFDYAITSKLSRVGCILLVISSVCMMLLRNNGLYAYVLMIPVIFLLEKKKWRKIVIFMITSVIIFAICSALLQISLRAENEEHQEILTVPIQQLARTYQYSGDSFTEDDKQILYEVLSEEALGTYSPKISDIIKSKFNNQQFSENPGRYFALWLRIGIRNPFSYMNAWFLTSSDYWYPDAILNCYGGIDRFTFQYTESSYFGFETEPPGIRYSLFPLLEKWYRNISLKLFQQRVPVVSMLFSPGFLFWVFAFFWIGMIKNRKREISFILCGVFLLWLTAVAGPAALVRYVLILWFILPALPAIYNSDSVDNITE